jgi:hypothetical protein
MDINTINGFLLPLLLFLVYLSIAAQFLPSHSTDNTPQPIDRSHQTTAANTTPTPKLSREELLLMNLKDLKQLCADLQIVPEGNRSKKQTWIDAIVAIG